jgi:chromosome segregation ATPase
MRSGLQEHSYRSHKMVDVLDEVASVHEDRAKNARSEFVSIVEELVSGGHADADTIAARLEKTGRSIEDLRAAVSHVNELQRLRATIDAAADADERTGDAKKEIQRLEAKYTADAERLQQQLRTAAQPYRAAITKAQADKDAASQARSRLEALRPKASERWIKLTDYVRAHSGQIDKTTRAMAELDRKIKQIDSLPERDPTDWTREGQCSRDPALLARLRRERDNVAAQLKQLESVLPLIQQEAEAASLMFYEVSRQRLSVLLDASEARAAQLLRNRLFGVGLDAVRKELLPV